MNDLIRSGLTDGLATDVGLSLTMVWPGGPSSVGDW
jgi:hypothetical protein